MKGQHQACLSSGIEKMWALVISNHLSCLALAFQAGHEELRAITWRRQIVQELPCKIYQR
jgi:hypothetical protein